MHDWPEWFVSNIELKSKIEEFRKYSLSNKLLAKHVFKDKKLKFKKINFVSDFPNKLFLIFKPQVVPFTCLVILKMSFVFNHFALLYGNFSTFASSVIIIWNKSFRSRLFPPNVISLPIVLNIILDNAGWCSSIKKWSSKSFCSFNRANNHQKPRDPIDLKVLPHRIFATASQRFNLIWTRMRAS